MTVFLVCGLLTMFDGTITKLFPFDKKMLPHLAIISKCGSITYVACLNISAYDIIHIGAEGGLEG